MSGAGDIVSLSGLMTLNLRCRLLALLLVGEVYICDDDPAPLLPSALRGLSNVTIGLSGTNPGGSWSSGRTIVRGCCSDPRTAATASMNSGAAWISGGRSRRWYAGGSSCSGGSGMALASSGVSRMGSTPVVVDGLEGGWDCSGAVRGL